MENVGVGIIGFGFVGSAIAHGFSLQTDIKIYDKYIQGLDSFEDVVNNSKFIFVCVPTPMFKNGKQDISIVQEVIKNISELDLEKRKIIIIKSTILPGTCRFLQKAYPKHPIIHSPEFLTERSAKLDFINSARIILGVENKKADYVRDCINLFRLRFKHTPIFVTPWESAEFVKYMCNSFFAMKVTFMNECYDVAKELNVDFEEITKMFLAEQRIGNSHVDVPGHDGKRGFGGKCFVKDVKAIINWAKKKGLSFEIMKTVDRVNHKLRKEKDWEKIKGVISTVEDDNEYLPTSER